MVKVSALGAGSQRFDPGVRSDASVDEPPASLNMVTVCLVFKWIWGYNGIIRMCLITIVYIV